MPTLKIFVFIKIYLLVSLPLVVYTQQIPLPKNTSSLSIFQDFEPIPMNMTDVVKQISYPPEAAQAGIEGLVQVLVWVDLYGNYMDHTVVSSPHELLSLAVEPFLHCLMFEPAIHNEQVAYGWRVLPFHFSLHPTLQDQVQSTNGKAICPKAEKPTDIPLIQF